MFQGLLSNAGQRASCLQPTLNGFRGSFKDTLKGYHLTHLSTERELGKGLPSLSNESMWKKRIVLQQELAQQLILAFIALQ